jgi:hypothetical protein
MVQLVETRRAAAFPLLATGGAALRRGAAVALAVAVGVATPALVEVGDLRKSGRNLCCGNFGAIEPNAKVLAAVNCRAI